MKLSIITINYNDAKGLQKTIESVKRQTYKDFEYIVVDGDSSDGSIDIIKKYDKYINKWVSEPDTGIYNAMNKGARMATCNYLLFLNSGDFLYSDSILEDLFKFKFCEDIVSCNLLLYNDKNQFIQCPPPNITLYTFTGGSLPHPSTLIKKSIFNKCSGYNENFKIISDWCFFIEALIVHNCSYKIIPITLSVFNCFGISSRKANELSPVMLNYVISRFPRIGNDYTIGDDEALSNIIFYIENQTGLYKKLLILPFKIINRLLHLRNRLGKRVITYKNREKYII